MKTEIVSIEYDENNPIAVKLIDFVISCGLFEVIEHSVEPGKTDNQKKKNNTGSGKTKKK